MLDATFPGTAVGVVFDRTGQEARSRDNRRSGSSVQGAGSRDERRSSNSVHGGGTRDNQRRGSSRHAPEATEDDMQQHPSQEKSGDYTNGHIDLLGGETGEQANALADSRSPERRVVSLQSF